MLSGGVGNPVRRARRFSFAALSCSLPHETLQSTRGSARSRTPESAPSLILIHGSVVNLQHGTPISVAQLYIFGRRYASLYHRCRACIAAFLELDRSSSCPCG